MSRHLLKNQQPSFKYARQVSNNLVRVHMGKAEVYLNKPILVGASVLGLSKLHMYKFWYEYVKACYGNKATLCYMNTDSFIFGAETEDIYQDMTQHADIFDFSDYPKDHQLVQSLSEDQWKINDEGERILKNTKVISLFKDESCETIMEEVFATRAKTYHYVLADGSNKSKHKGVSKTGMTSVASNTYSPTLGGSLLDETVSETFDPMTQLYRDCLFGEEVFTAKNVGFKTKDHVISLVESKKRALCPLDDKC